MPAGFPAKVNYATGDVLTAANMNDLGGTLNLLESAQYAAGKNRVLNSNYSVWQRGTSISVSASANVFTCDRWNVSNSSNQAMTVSRQATSDTTNLPFIQYCARVQRNAGQTGTNAKQFASSFESVNSIPLAGKTVTLSFYARAGANYSAASNALIAAVITGTGTDQNYLLTGYTGQASPIYSTVTLTTTWQRFTLSATLAATATELTVSFIDTPVGTAGANDYFEVTGVQLEAASTASPYAPNSTTQQGELAACQRYYYRTSLASEFTVHATGLASSATVANILFPVPVTMRAKPSALDFSTLQVTDYVSGFTPSTIIIQSATPAGNTTVLEAACVGLTPFRPYVLRNPNNTAGYVGLSAEL